MNKKEKQLIWIADILTLTALLNNRAINEDSESLKMETIISIQCSLDILRDVIKKENKKRK